MGGARPERMDSAAETTVAERAQTASPTCLSPSRVRWAGSAAASADDPMRQIAQCVVDLAWQTTSWCASGISAAASRYVARTTFSRRPRLGPAGIRLVTDICEIEYRG